MRKWQMVVAVVGFTFLTGNLVFAGQGSGRRERRKANSRQKQVQKQERRQEQKQERKQERKQVRKQHQKQRQEQKQVICKAFDVDQNGKLSREEAKVARELLDELIEED